MKAASGRSAGVAIALGALVVFAAGEAAAQGGCSNDGGVPLDYGSTRDLFPTPMATGVPLDGFVRIRYVQRVPSGAYVQVHADSDQGPSVDGQATQVGDDEVHWRATRSFDPNRTYYVHFVADLLGATDQVIRFSTGTQLSSTARPTFDGALQGSSSFTRSGATDTCGDPGAILVNLGWRSVQGSRWPATDHEYVLFQTAGPGLDGVVERARVRGRSSAVTCAGGAEQCWTVRLPSSMTSGRVCFNVQALDAYGTQLPDSSGQGANRSEVCVDPQVGNYFNGCAARPHPRSSRALLPALGALAALALLRRRSARSG